MLTGKHEVMLLNRIKESEAVTYAYTGELPCCVCYYINTLLTDLSLKDHSEKSSREAPVCCYSLKSYLTMRSDLTSFQLFQLPKCEAPRGNRKCASIQTMKAIPN